MKTKKAFTVLELVLAIIFVGVFVVLFFLQKVNLAAMDRDEKRKTAINAMYYALEEGYYVQNEAYPEHIEKADVLPWIDPNLFTDPMGINLWDEGSNYSYEASDCTDGKCQSYVLRAEMEKEASYIKSSRN
ncbi:hypothetical protein IKQ65_02945 [Candidatus Saccharibacteria bacterium]|nr:hypothetical protein [Candidatus Saccharibacteria bacterium]MBR6961851.1 hypothetical protein [Candidatus Saccharibacteria bacterium]